MKHLLIILILLPILLIPQEQAKKPIFFQQYDIQEVLASGSILLYEQGKDKLDSLRQEWEKNFGTIYLYTITIGDKVIATLDSDLNFTIVDSTFNKDMLKNSLFILAVQMQAQRR